MNKKKCPICGSMHTVKNGVRNGKQLYVCKSCNHQFRSGAHIDSEALWRKYQEEKRTISAIVKEYELSISTIKRRLKEIIANLYDFSPAKQIYHLTIERVSDKMCTFAHDYVTFFTRDKGNQKRLVSQLRPA